MAIIFIFEKVDRIASNIQMNLLVNHNHCAWFFYICSFLFGYLCNEHIYWDEEQKNWG